MLETQLPVIDAAPQVEHLGFLQEMAGHLPPQCVPDIGEVLLIRHIRQPHGDNDQPSVLPQGPEGPSQALDPAGVQAAEVDDPAIAREVFHRLATDTGQAG